jgi:hypothetical protein
LFQRHKLLAHCGERMQRVLGSLAALSSVAACPIRAFHIGRDSLLISITGTARHNSHPATPRGGIRTHLTQELPGGPPVFGNGLNRRSS